MGLTNIAIDTFISQGLSKLDACDAPDLESEFDQAEYWVSNFILNSIFRANVQDKIKPVIFGILRRAQMAIIEYESGRKELLNYLAGPKDSVSVYFKALYRFELVVYLIYQANDIGMKATGIRLFEKGDGSPIERLNRIYNVSKHLEVASIPEGNLHAVWLSNEGINVSTTSLEWHELADLVKEIGRLANKMSDPASFAKEKQPSGNSPASN